MLRGYDTDYRGYDACCKAYKEDLESFRAKLAEYVKNKESLDRKDTQERQPLAASLEREWEDPRPNAR